MRHGHIGVTQRSKSTMCICLSSRNFRLVGYGIETFRSNATETVVPALLAISGTYYLNHDLEWSHHIDQVTARPARKLGFIRRNLRGAPMDCKKLSYITLVRSGMEYASIIWDRRTKCDSEKLDRVQRSATRWILSSYSWKTSATSLLQRLQLEPLEERRRVQRLVFMYKILNDHVAVPAASVDLILSSRLSRGVDANSQKVTVKLKTTGCVFVSWQ